MSRLLQSRAADPALALLIFVFALTELADGEVREGSLAANAAVVAVMAAGFAIRRRAPLAAAGLFIGSAAALALFLTNPSEIATAFLGLVLIPYAAGAHAGPRTAVAVTAGCAGLVFVVELLGDGVAMSDVLFPTGFAVAALLAGRSVRARSRLAAELHELALQAEEAREQEAGRAQVEERRRIAREMHDVVAHSISVMVVQAGGARRIIDRDPERAERAARDIERTGREALVEMRRLLGVLHHDDEPAARAPQPGLDGLDALVERARAAGLPVEVDVEGARRDVPAGLDLTAYRIVQEALTNAIRHAGAAATAVRLRWTDEALEIEVADRGGGSRLAGPDGTGHGLIGMHERARLYGGELQAGPRRDGGFEVRARLPLQAQEVPA